MKEAKERDETQMTQTARFPAGSAREAVLTSLLVLVCFGVFLGVVRFTFPEGTTLRGLVQSDAGTGEALPGGSRALAGDALGTRMQGFATVVTTVRSVKDKPPSAIAWQDSPAGLRLGDRHSIQTGKGSVATIQFTDRSSIRLTENSLLMFKSIDEEEDGSDRQATLVMLGGSIDGVLAGGDGQSMTLAIETPHGVAHLRSKKESPEEAEFRLDVAEDETTTLSVLRGSVELTTETETVRVEPLRMISVRKEGISRPRVLPDAPRALQPSADADWTFGTVHPVIEFRWTAVPGADEYRFVLATDRNVQDVVLERTTRSPTVECGNLEAGDYWWAATARQDGLSGAMAKPRHFSITQDVDPPALVVDWPGVPAQSATYRLTGRTEVGASVFVADAQANVAADGSFEIDLELDRGANVVVVESVDSAGNINYESRIVGAEY